MRQEIIQAYLRILELVKTPVRIEWQLPFPRNVIRRAIREELLDNPGTDARDCLEVAYAEIESFISMEDYELLRRFKETCTLAEEMARGGKPGDILASSRLMERICGEKAVRVLERVSNAMRRQLQLIRSTHLLPCSMGLPRATST
jgi:hypothetical protein